MAAPGLAGAAPSVLLTADTNDLNVSEHLSVFTDRDANLGVEHVTAAAFADRFKGSERGEVRQGLSTERVWARLHLQNQSAKGRWYLLIDYPLLDDVRVYIKRGQLVELVGRAGDQQLYSTRPLRLPDLVFPIDFKSASDVSVFISVQTEGALLVPARLLSESELARWLSNRQTFLGLYFGLVGLLVLYGFVFFFYFRRSHYLIYTGLTGAQLVWLMGESGLLYHYIFFGWPQAMNLVMVIALTCIAFLGFKLDEIFLRRSLKPHENQILKRCKQLSLVCVILSIIMPYGTAVRMAVGLQMLYMSVSFWLALACLIRGYKPARIFFMAMCCAVFAGLLIMLRSMGVLALDALSLQGPMVGVGAFTLLMSLALTDKISFIQRERETLAASFEKFVPKTLVTKLIRSSQVARLGGERREVTILFSDIRGYSTIIEHLDPADVVSLMTSYFDAMQRIIEKNGGVILEFTGDGILAVFGAPTELGDHPTAAIRSALSMRSAIEKLNERWHQTSIFHAASNAGVDSLFNRIGIHTGSVIAGNLGSHQTMKYGVVGDAVNVAARLEALNKILSTDILFSHDTYLRLDTEAQNQAECHGAQALKGRAEGMVVYSLPEAIDASLDGTSSYHGINQEFEWWNEENPDAP